MLWSTELLGWNIGTLGRIRTCDQPFRKRRLYPLSYEGVEAPTGVEPAKAVLQTAADPLGFDAGNLVAPAGFEPALPT